jgi:hypothetical protein
MFQYLQYLVEKFLGFFGKNRETNSELKKILIENKRFLNGLINIQADYTRQDMIDILTHELSNLNLEMNKSVEIEELRFEDIEKKTFLEDILYKIRDLNDE